MKVDLQIQTNLRTKVVCNIICEAVGLNLSIKILDFFCRLLCVIFARARYLMSVDLRMRKWEKKKWNEHEVYYMKYNHYTVFVLCVAIISFEINVKW